MPIDWLVLGSAALTGLLGGVHCAAMCGGIAAGFGAMSGRARLSDALQANLARVAGYVIAGALAGGIGSGVVRVARLPWLGMASRALVGGVLIVAALRLLDIRALRFLAQPGQRLWGGLKPLQARLLPANTPARRIALGVLWGWLPCGLSTTMVAAAWLQASARNGALTMFAFGLATLPLMVPLTWSGARALDWLRQRRMRPWLAGMVFLAGLLTLAAPWLVHVPAMHALLVRLGCGALS